MDTSCFISVNHWRIWTTTSVTFLLALNWKLLPCSWKYFTNINLVVIHVPVIISHPPSIIIFESKVDFFFESLWVVPSLIFISISSCLFGISPRIYDSYKLDSESQSDVENTISMIILNSLISHTFLRISIFIGYLFWTSK